MIEIKEINETHIDDIHGLALTECKEFNVPLYITREMIETYVKEVNEASIFSRCLITEGVVVGFIFTRKDRNLPTAMIEQLFIHPKFRGSISFLRLLKQTEKWAKEKECQLLIVGGLASINKEHANKLGFNLDFTYYGKELKW